MEATPVSMNGARKLVHRIFLQGSYVGNGKSDVQNVKNVTGASSNQNQTPTKDEKVTKGGQNAKNASGVLSNHKQTPSKKKKPFRLPKRLKGIVPLFLMFLVRHRKCPFQVLLKHHCTFSERRARVIKSGKKKGRLFSTPKTTMWSKRGLKRHGSKGVKRPPGKKKIKVDVLVYRHAVSNYTRHDQVRQSWISVFYAVDSGYQLLDFEFQGISGIPNSLSCIPDSKAKDSGSNEQKDLGFRIPHAKISRIPES